MPSPHSVKSCTIFSIKSYGSCCCFIFHSCCQSSGIAFIFSLAEVSALSTWFLIFCVSAEVSIHLMWYHFLYHLFLHQVCITFICISKRTTVIRSFITIRLLRFCSAEVSVHSDRPRRPQSDLESSPPAMDSLWNSSTISPPKALLSIIQDIIHPIYLDHPCIYSVILFIINITKLIIITGCILFYLLQYLLLHHHNCTPAKSVSEALQKICNLVRESGFTLIC